MDFRSSCHKDVNKSTEGRRMGMGLGFKLWLAGTCRLAFIMHAVDFAE